MQEYFEQSHPLSDNHDIMGRDLGQKHFGMLNVLSQIEDPRRSAFPIHQQCPTEYYEKYESLSKEMHSPSLGSSASHTIERQGDILTPQISTPQYQLF